jgi:amino acid adenylation domain-containing protein
MVAIQGKNKDIEAIYPLSSVQAGMLFHTLYQPESRIYFEQFRMTISGDLNAAIFEQAWQQVIQRHPALRTLFVWKNRKQPLQLVRRQVDLPWVNMDWRSITIDEQQLQIDAFFDADQLQGLEIDQAPLMRFALIRMADRVYQFVWSFHHILLDGWSWPILFKELFGFYESIANGEQLYVAPEKPYGEYISWLQEQNLAEAESFWRQNLEGFTVPTPLVGERDLRLQAIDNLEHQSSVSAVRQQHLAAESTAMLKSFAQQHHLTVSTLVQAAWALLLSRYSGEDDVVFGATVSGRPPSLAGVESMVGLFINTLPVRIKIPKVSDLVPWLQQLQQEHFERDHYSYTPLVDIQGWSDVGRDRALFESIVVFENYPVNFSFQALPGNLKIEDRACIGQTNYPLALIAIPGAELVLKMNYDRVRFDEDTIDRMMSHLLTLLMGIVTNIDRPISELPLLTAAEHQLLLVDWNTTQSAVPLNCGIHQLFEQQVINHPDAVAVVDGDQQLTYQQLNQRANQLAHYLQGLGVKPDVPVGICLERSLGAMVAILGTLKAGGACVLLDPQYPIERLVLMLKDTSTPILLTQTNLKSLWEQDFQQQLILVDEDWDKISRESDLDLKIEIESDRLAYIIYTSGSTGTPKGTLVPHRSLTNLIEHHQAQMLTGVGVLQFAALSFDVSYHEMFAAWGLGGTLYLIPETDRQDLDKLIHLLASAPIAKVFLPVSLWQQLAEIYGEQIHLFKHIREAIACGEQLQITQSMIKLFKCLENCKLYNFYGPTEADLVTVYTFSREPDKWPLYPPIGKPAVNVQVYLFDRHFQPVPIGVPGELYVSGNGLAHGYLNRPDLTAQKFISHFDRESKPIRLYKTGDLARYLPDGNLEFLGRIDDLVKVRGFRVELGEVEAVLSKHPQVDRVVAKVYGESAREKYLVAYLIPTQGATVTVEQLRLFLTEQLPDYLIPSAYVLLSSFPLTPNGKVNRRALLEPTIVGGASRVENRLQLSQTFVEPRTPIEEILAGIWGDILGVEKVGIYDNFFDLGGHSLRATQVISLIRKAFKVELTLKSLFTSPTIAAVTKIIETLSQQQQGTEIIPIEAAVRSDDAVIPISLTQLEFWFFDQFYPKNTVYNLPLVYRIAGVLNITALEQSLREIVRRHQTLRSNFQVKDGQVVYSISPEPVFDFTIVDLQQLPETEREIQLKQLAEQEIKQPFDLANGRLFRAKIWQLSDTDNLLAIATHHIVADGWSFTILTQELTTLYAAFSQNQPSLLNDLPLQYADFATWQQAWFQGEKLQNQMQFWQQQLGINPPILELPTDYPRPNRRTFTGSRQPLVLDLNLSQALKKLSQQAGASLFMTLLTALNILLFAYTNQEKIIVSTPIANRTRVETESTIGFFVHLLPFCTNLGGNPSFRALLDRVREMALGVYTHQEMPLIKLIEELQPVRIPGYTLLSQVMFVFQNTPEDDFKLDNLTLTEQSFMLDTKDTAEFDLNLTLQETSAGIEGALCYRTDLFAASTIAKMVNEFQTLLATIVLNPDRRLAELCLSIDKSNLKLPQSIPPPFTPETALLDESSVPLDPIETTILAIWQAVLGVDEIGKNDNFFELGGNSIQALQAIAKLEEICQLTIPLAAIFEHPTIAKLASAIC